MGGGGQLFGGIRWDSPGSAVMVACERCYHTATHNYSPEGAGYSAVNDTAHRHRRPVVALRVLLEG